MAPPRWWSRRRPAGSRVGERRLAAAPSAAASTFQPIRRERLIAGCRVALSVFSLLALWLDPSEPTRFAGFTYALIAVYAGYSVLVALWVWTAKATPAAFPFLAHAVDLALFCVVIFVTEGPTSPFFAYFVFALAAATVRWQEAGTLWTAAAALAAFLVIGLYSASRFPGEGFELNRFIIRSIYLAVVAVLLGYVGAYEHRLRARVAGLGEWPAVMPTEAAGLVRTLLEHAAQALAAPRTMLVWEEPEEPWSNVALWSNWEFDWRREAPDVYTPPAPPELADTAFFLAEKPGGDAPHRLLTPGGLKPWTGDPVPAGLRARLGFGAVLSVPLRGESVEGRLFALDRPDMTSDELVLGEILARRIALQMDRLALFERLHQAGLAEERVRLARDLHDGVIQSLTGAALRLESARQLVGGDPAAAERLIAEIQDLLVSEQRELREFIADLEAEGMAPRARPGGLEERLAKLGERIARHWDLRVELQAQLAGEGISDGLAHEVYCIVHEALVNASRHGRASLAKVDVRLDDRAVHVVVSDDGKGFPFYGSYDFATLTAHKLGPVSLKRRVGTLGGRLDIDSSAAGARLEVTLPREQPGA
jgi:signal transduction histidine kinase